MDAIRRMRRRAMEFGYLQPNDYVNVVSTAGYIEILPSNPAVIYAPDYDPVIVFSRPAPRVGISGAIQFGPGIAIGAAFATWGWANVEFIWPSHTIIIDRHPGSGGGSTGTSTFIPMRTLGHTRWDYL